MGQLLPGYSSPAILAAVPVGPDAALFEGALWIGALILGTVLATAGLVWLRRRLQSTEERTRPSFTLEQLNRLHDEGALTAAEYRLLRRRAAEWFGEGGDGD